MKSLGIIGGSGLYEMEGLTRQSTDFPSTPYGSPSGPLVSGELDGVRLVFLPRHGTNHNLAPHQVNYRANICALKMAGVEQVVSVSAVGSMKEEIAPGHVVVVDQYIDWTRGRVSTFFDEEVVAHVSLADPVCAQLSLAVARAAKGAGATVHERGTYLCMQGPQFSTRAESQLYRGWGADVIGMTAMPEAKLAREAQLPYATVAFATDYDCWREGEQAVSVDAVLAVLRRNARRAQDIVRRLPVLLPDASKSPATEALKYAIVSHGKPQSATQQRLAWLLESGGD